MRYARFKNPVTRDATIRSNTEITYCGNIVTLYCHVSTQSKRVFITIDKYSM